MSRIVLMFSLVVAGELIFGLPFQIARFFRPTLLDVMGFSNTELGDIFFVYGVAALLAYFPGGALADHFSARSLMACSLFATAAGGVYMATLPGVFGMAMLYGYWGVTTVFLFWGALIRATREWGDRNAQGRAFGILDGGRGLAAAAFAYFAVTVLASYLPAEVEAATAEQRTAGFRTVVWLYTAVTCATGVLVWFAIPVGDKPEHATSNRLRKSLQGMTIVLRRPVVWAQAGIIVCAYCAFKGLDNYGLYAKQVLGLDEVRAAELTVYGSFLRAPAALLAGVIADRCGATRSVGVMFVVLTLLYAVWSLATPQGEGVAVIYGSFFVSFAAVYALRGIYFALLEEARTPVHLTGAAVGMVSFVGYTPDVFFAPVTGRILDANPGIVGHQHYFQFLAAISLVGIAVAVWMLWLQRRSSGVAWPASDGVAK